MNRFWAESVAIASIAVAFVLAGCGGSSVSRRTRVEPDGGESYTTETRIYTDRDEARLDAGREARRAGRYVEATGTFLEVYEKASAKPEYRAQALLELGRAYMDPLNAKRDPARALAYFEKLVAEFPASKHRTKAMDYIEDLKGGGGQ